MNHAPTLPLPTNGALAEVSLPATTETTLLLHRLLDKVERIESRMTALAPLLDRATGLVSMATDTIDNLIANATAFS